MLGNKNKHSRPPELSYKGFYHYFLGPPSQISSHWRVLSTWSLIKVLQPCKFFRQTLCKSYVYKAECEERHPQDQTIAVLVLVTKERSSGRIKPFQACPRAKTAMTLSKVFRYNPSLFWAWTLVFRTRKLSRSEAHCVDLTTGINQRFLMLP